MIVVIVHKTLSIWLNTRSLSVIDRDPATIVRYSDIQLLYIAILLGVSRASLRLYVRSITDFTPGNKWGSLLGGECTSSSMSETLSWTTLTDDEEVLWHEHPVLVAMVGVVVGTLVFDVILAGIGAVMFTSHTLLVLGGATVLSILIVGFRFLDLQQTGYVITNQFVYKKTGILGRDVDRTRFQNVQDVSYDQGIIARSLGYGTVKCETAGSGTDSSITFQFVSSPQKVQDLISDRLRTSVTRSGKGTQQQSSGNATGVNESNEELTAEMRRLREAVEDLTEELQETQN